jgi:hypothetical protein
MSSHEALQALIDGTKALGFDHPVLETIEEPSPNQEAFTCWETSVVEACDYPDC